MRDLRPNTKHDRTHKERELQITASVRLEDPVEAEREEEEGYEVQALVRLLVGWELGVGEPEVGRCYEQDGEAGCCAESQLRAKRVALYFTDVKGLNCAQKTVCHVTEVCRCAEYAAHWRTQ